MKDKKENEQLKMSAAFVTLIKLREICSAVDGNVDAKFIVDFIDVEMTNNIEHIKKVCKDRKTKEGLY